MKSSMKRGIATALTLVMAVGMLTGCGQGKKKKDGAVSYSSKRNKDVVYSLKDIPMENDGKGSPSRMIVANNRMYAMNTEYLTYHNGELVEGYGFCKVPTESVVYGNKVVTSPVPMPTPVETDDLEMVDITDDYVMEPPVVIDPGYGVPDEGDYGDDYYDEGEWTYETRVTIAWTNLDGSAGESFSFVVESNEYTRNFDVDANGQVYVASMLESSTWDDEGNYSFSSTPYLRAFSAQGELIKEFTFDVKPDEYSYLAGMVALEDGGCAALMDGLYIFDSNLNIVAEEKDCTDYGNLYRMSKNRLCLSKWGDVAQEYYIYDIAAKQLSEKKSTPFGSTYRYTIYPGTSYDLYLVDSMSIFGFSFDTGEMKELMNFVDSDAAFNSPNYLVEISDKEFLICYYDYTTYGDHYVIATKVNPEDVKDAIILNLACYYPNNQLRNYVTEFNKTNGTYRISLTDYGQYDSYSNDDYTSGTVQFHNDLISGKIPDIILFSDQMNSSIYANKGLLADLYSFLDNDSVLSRDAFVPNILEAYTIKGKLYELTDSFTVRTMIGKTSVVGDGSDWSVAKMNQLLKEYPDAVMLMDSSKEDILDLAMDLAGGQFVNYASGECKFDSAEFIELLELINRFPDEVVWEWDEDTDWEAYWNERELAYRNNKALLRTIYLYNFRYINSTRQGEFGEDVSFVGFPSKDTNGAILCRENGSFAITNQSKNKDGAWQFIRHFFTKDYQDAIAEGMGSFPVLKSSWSIVKDKSQEKYYWIDDDGTVNYMDDTYYIGGEEIVISQLTDAEYEELYNYVISVTSIDHTDTDLINIIKEEAAAFFGGQKNAKDVAAIIQSRAFTYINESR